MTSPSATDGEGRPMITPGLVCALRRDAGDGATVLWLYLWARADVRTARAWPTTKTMATELGAFRNRISSRLSILEKAGWLQVERVPGTRNQYVVTVPQSVVSESGHPQEACMQDRAGVVCESGQGLYAKADDHPNTTKNTSKNTTKTRRRSAWEADIEIPESLRSERFEVAWAEWLAYRSQRRLSRAPMTLERQLAMLARLGTDGAVQAIETSIRNGWQGIFAGKGPRNGNGHSDGDQPPRGKYDPSRRVEPI